MSTIRGFREFDRTAKQTPCSALGTPAVRQRTTPAVRQRYASVYASVGGRKTPLSRCYRSFSQKSALRNALVALQKIRYCPAIRVLKGVQVNENRITVVRRRPTQTLEEKVQHAAAHYERKYGSPPNLCYVHPAALSADRQALVNNDKVKKVDQVEIRSGRSVLPHHFWLGVAEKARQTKSQEITG